MSSAAVIELVFTTLASFTVAIGALTKVIQWQKAKWLEDQNIMRRLTRVERYLGIYEDTPLPRKRVEDSD